MKYPTAREVAQAFVKYAPGREDRYDHGVRNPDADWETETAKAEPNYEKGVTAAISRKAFGKGVKKAGTAKQQSQTIKNIPRWAEGIRDAEDVMAAAMANVETVMKGITLPPKFPKGDERNYARNKIIGVTLRKAKEEGRI